MFVLKIDIIYIIKRVDYLLFLLGVLEGCFIGCIVACGNLLRATNILRGMEVACNAMPTHTREGCAPHIHI